MGRGCRAAKVPPCLRTRTVKSHACSSLDKPCRSTKRSKHKNMPWGHFHNPGHIQSIPTIENHTKKNLEIKKQQLANSMRKPQETVDILGDCI